VPEDGVGRRARCPTCGTVQVIGQGSPAKGDVGTKGAIDTKGAMPKSARACPDDSLGGAGTELPSADSCPATIEGPRHARADLGMAPESSMASMPAGPEKSPPAPAPKDEAGEPVIDLTQFNEWVPDNVPAGARPPKGPMKAKGAMLPSSEACSDDSRVARHASENGSMAPNLGVAPKAMAPKLSMPPTPAVSKKPLGDRSWEIIAGQNMIDLTLLNQLRFGEVQAQEAIPAANNSRANAERLGHASADGSMAPAPGRVPTPAATQDAATDADLAYAEECRAAIRWRRQALADGSTAVLLDDLAYDQETLYEPPGDGVLESRTAVWVIVAMGVAGILGGAVGGYFIFHSHPIAGVYIGGALGWVAGFVIACLFVLSVERDDNRLRCPSCQEAFPDGTELCPQCACALSGPSVNPIARGGQQAGSYALEGKWAVAGIAMLGFIGGSIAQGVYRAGSQNSYLHGWGWGLIGLVGLILVYLGGYLLEFLLSAVAHTLRMDSHPPSLPSLLSRRPLLAALGAAAIACMYALPLVTLPLLPLALLHLSAAGMGKALNPKLILTAALRRPGDLAVLWLVTFLWIGGLLLSLALAVVAFIGMDRIPAVLGTADTPWMSGVRAGVWILLTALKFAMVLTVVGAFGLAIARCVGLFGRRIGLRPPQVKEELVAPPSPLAEEPPTQPSQKKRFIRRKRSSSDR